MKSSALDDSDVCQSHDVGEKAIQYGYVTQTPLNLHNPKTVKSEL